MQNTMVGRGGDGMGGGNDRNAQYIPLKIRSINTDCVWLTYLQ